VDSLINICIPDFNEITITTEDEIDITTESGELLITEDSPTSTITILVTFDNGTTNEIIIIRNA
jgi:hypothetical protein